VAQWRQACLTAAADRVVLLDDRDRPVGLVSLVRLLLFLGDETAIAPQQTEGEGAITATLPPALAALLETAPVLAAQTSPEQAAHIIAGAVRRPWLVIDDEQRYVGVLNAACLLDALRDKAPTSPVAEAPVADLPAVPSTTAVLSQSTALLTYLGHELKTPLTSLLGLSSLLETERLGPLNERQSRYVTLIQQHARRLTALVNAVLDLGRIEAGQLHLMPQIVEIAPLCREAYRQAQLLVPEAPMVAMDALPQLVLVADTLRLGQMLTYLIQLALKAAVPPSDFPLTVQIWGDWIAICPLGLGESLVQRLNDEPGNARGGAVPDGLPGSGWLELLLTRYLAHLHGGDLLLGVTGTDQVEPVLLLPRSTEDQDGIRSQLLVLASSDPALAKTVAAQVRPLGYHLLLVPPEVHGLEAIARLEPAAVLIPAAADLPAPLLKLIKADPRTQNRLTLALWLDGEPADTTLPADSIVPWPSTSLATVLQSQPQPRLLTPERITVLYLKSSHPPRPGAPPEPQSIDISGLFHDSGCRVLEVDDLDQADLVSRVWKPDVIVLDPDLHEPDVYLQSLIHIPHLAQLAIVTLTAEATHLAHQWPGLQVFPCLPDSCTWRQPDQQAQIAHWLMQVLQGAIAQRP
jgi:signal transduction histidine kinase